ncbi:MAG: hypothetical protein J7527_00445 [Chitinophagaceae bacterium]|nr:hypothetical protein [Chitinophagaceae bacterium]
MTKKSKTKTGANKPSDVKSSHRRKNSNAGTRAAARQRSGNNEPQQGSH